MGGDIVVLVVVCLDPLLPMVIVVFVFVFVFVFVLVLVLALVLVLEFLSTG